LKRERKGPLSVFERDFFGEFKKSSPSSEFGSKTTASERSNEGGSERKRTFDTSRRGEEEREKKEGEELETRSRLKRQCRRNDVFEIDPEETASGAPSGRPYSISKFRFLDAMEVTTVFAHLYFEGVDKSGCDCCQHWCPEDGLYQIPTKVKWGDLFCCDGPIEYDIAPEELFGEKISSMVQDFVY